MLKNFNKIGIIIYGPPGSGKGTQAKLTAEKLGLFHFDTGQYLRGLLYNPKFQKNKIIQKEMRLNKAGNLNTPSWVLKIISQRVKKIAGLGQGIVFSGSPRTIFEAFGGKKRIGLIRLLEKLYNKKNIFIFALKIPEKESIKRNIKRRVCSVCKTPILRISKYRNIEILNCPFCGGKLEYRVDDKKEIVLARLKEYRERTLPIQKELKKRGYEIIDINGESLPEKVHKSIIASFR